MSKNFLHEYMSINGVISTQKGVFMSNLGNVDGPEGFPIGKKVIVDKDNNVTITREVKPNSVWTKVEDNDSRKLLQEIFESDKNGDGKFDYRKTNTYDEGMDLQGNKFSRTTTEIDADGDGKVDYRSQKINYPDQNREEIKIDCNGDGNFDEAVGIKHNNKFSTTFVDQDNDGNVDFIQE